MDKWLDFSEYKKICCGKEVINWWQLFPNHSVTLEPEYQTQILKDALQKVGNYSSLSRELHLPRKTISACYQLKQKLTVAYLIKILKYTNRPLSDANSKFIEIVGLKRPKLPFVLSNPESAEIIAAFLSDGHLPIKSYKNPMYCAYERELHDRLILLSKKVFGEFDVETKAGHNSPLTRFPCPIGTALELAGVPRGDKRRKNSPLPKVVIGGSEDLQCAYLRRVFDDEGDVQVSNSKRAVRITRSTDATDIYAGSNFQKQKWLYGVSNTPINNLILGEYLLLKKAGIDARLYREGVYRSISGRTTVKWRIQIAQQDNLRLFAEKINFNLLEKKEKLNLAIHSYIHKKTANGVTEKIIWAHVFQLSKQKKFISFGDVGKKLISLGLSYDFAGVFLRKFVKSGRIEKLKRGVYVVK
jgi:hypothetical protein